MGSVLDIGGFDGYSLELVGKLFLRKEKRFSEIFKLDRKIYKEVKDIVEFRRGLVYVVMKDNIIQGIYIFKKRRNTKKKVLALYKRLYIKDAGRKVTKHYDNMIMSICSSMVGTYEYDEIIYNKKTVKRDITKSEADMYNALICSFGVGFIFGWLLFKVIAMGIVFGLIFMSLGGGASVVVTKNNKTGNK